jgi:predicted DNA-binding transcriptional regulator AlpA
MKKKHSPPDADAIPAVDDCLTASDLAMIAAVDDCLQEFGPLLTHEQVAKLLGIHSNTLYWWCVRGIFPKPMLVGPRLKRWPKQVVRDYLIARARWKDCVA